MNWTVGNCIKKGRVHEERNLICQDSVYEMKTQGVSCIALADGAGSRKLSDVGAELAVRQACYCVSDHFEQLWKETEKKIGHYICSEVIYRLHNYAEKMGCQVEELASTLLLLAVKDTRVLFYHLGDGLIGCQERDEVKILSHPWNGRDEWHTALTTTKEVSYYARTGKRRLDQTVRFFLMSDGLTSILYNRRRHCFTKQAERLLKGEMKQQIPNFMEVYRSKLYDDSSIIWMEQI